MQIHMYNTLEKRKRELFTFLSYETNYNDIYSNSGIYKFILQSIRITINETAKIIRCCSSHIGIDTD